jgi:Transposase
VPGRAVNRAADGYPREGKTDARDARVIADQARLRRDFAPLAPTPELVADLRVLTGYRQDLTGDRTRMVTRLRQHRPRSSRPWSGHWTSPTWARWSW